MRGAIEPAVLGKGLRVRGRIRGEGDLTIEADVEGDVVVRGALELVAGARVNGGVEADSLVVAGEIDGDVTAKGAVAITASGSLRGDVRAAELSLEEGGTFLGSVEADFELPDTIS